MSVISVILLVVVFIILIILIVGFIFLYNFYQRIKPVIDFTEDRIHEIQKLVEKVNSIASDTRDNLCKFVGNIKQTSIDIDVPPLHLKPFDFIPSCS